MSLLAAKSLPQMTGWAKAMGVVCLRSTVDEVTLELEVGEIHR
jgi:hypothetical protein